LQDVSGFRPRPCPGVIGVCHAYACIIPHSVAHTKFELWVALRSHQWGSLNYFWLEHNATWAVVNNIHSWFGKQQIRSIDFWACTSVCMKNNKELANGSKSPICWSRLAKAKGVKIQFFFPSEKYFIVLSIHG
jgi:hypothetical protein